MTTSSESLLATPTHLTGHYTVTSPELFIQLYMLRFIPEHTRPTQTISRIKACPRSHQDPPLQPTQNDPVESKPQFTKVVAQQPQPGPLHITSKNLHSKANAHDPTLLSASARPRTIRGLAAKLSSFKPTTGQHQRKRSTVSSQKAFNFPCSRESNQQVTATHCTQHHTHSPGGS